MFRPRRQGRYWHRLEEGFLSFEARTVSALKKDVPYLKDIVADRRKIVKNAARAGWSRAQYEREIKSMYKNYDWVVQPSAKTRKGSIGMADPWAMIRFYAQRYKKDHPEFESPGDKKPKQPKILSPEGLEKSRAVREHKKQVRKQRQGSSYYTGG